LSAVRYCVLIKGSAIRVRKYESEIDYSADVEDTFKKFKEGTDEELSRMSQMANIMKQNSLLLCNESFAATNEREGTEIARQITSALVECGIKIFFVTQLYIILCCLWRSSKQPFVTV
jgi:hypothetical protein